MSIASAEVLSLEEYLLKDRVLLVPPWQREYKWGSGDTTNKDQVNRLLEDLDEFVLSDAEQYFMGLLTLTKTPHTVEGKSVNFIVDGQQRTVTMQIFLMCCYEYLSRKNDSMIPITDANLYSRLENLISFSSRVGAPRSLRVRFDQSGANTALEIIHTWMRAGLSDRAAQDKLLQEAPDDSQTMDNLLEVRRFFTEELEHYDESGKGIWFGGDLNKALSKIISGLRFIELQISDEQEAMDIYNKMNSRGMGLDAADLIKNQLFANVKDDKAFDEISDHWNTMAESLRNHKASRFKEPVFLVRSYAGMLWGKPHRDKELAAIFGKYLSGDKTDSVLPSSDPLDFINDLRSLAQDSVENCAEKTNYPLLFAAQRIGAVQHFPLVLVGSYLKSESLRQHFYNQVGSRAILQVLSKEHPPHVENIYPQWASQIFAKRNTLSVEELDFIYNSFAFKRGDASSEEISNYRNERAAVLDAQVDSLDYGIASNKRKIGFLLALLSWHIDKVAEHTTRLSDYLNLKSLDPQTGKLVKWEIDHIAANALAGDRIPNNLKQGIGNLVLLNYKKNRGAGNGAPETKKDSYTIKSSLILTKITDYTTFKSYEKDLKNLNSIKMANDNPWDLNNWTEVSIENRAKFLKSLLREFLFSI
jgi:hypothetical protein